MIIHLISSPRNISTALMYSFARRPDTYVVDEPFYARYLSLSGAKHPGRKSILESQPLDTATILQEISDSQLLKKNVFVKNMAHHLIEINLEMLPDFQHVFLIRDPKRLLFSFAKVIENPTMSDVGVAQQYELYKKLSTHTAIPVIDSDELLKNPENVLSKLCDQLNISFTTRMLNWKPGPISQDGIWAKYWYGQVHQSTGFKEYTDFKESLPERLTPLYDECKLFYERLFPLAIKAD